MIQLILKFWKHMKKYQEEYHVTFKLIEKEKSFYHIILAIYYKKRYILQINLFSI